MHQKRLRKSNKSPLIRSNMTVNDTAAWSVDDIEQEAANWTLSSDVQMLQFMETFSENLMSKLNTTSTALEQLICFTGVSWVT